MNLLNSKYLVSNVCRHPKSKQTGLNNGYIHCSKCGELHKHQYATKKV